MVDVLQFAGDFHRTATLWPEGVQGLGLARPSRAVTQQIPRLNIDRCEQAFAVNPTVPNP